jgi:hypothetical protein
MKLDKRNVWSQKLHVPSSNHRLDSRILYRVSHLPIPVWTGAENLAPIGIRSSNRPARSQPLYRLSYSAHHVKMIVNFFLTISRYPNFLSIKLQTHVRWNTTKLLASCSWVFYSGAISTSSLIV